MSDEDLEHIFSEAAQIAGQEERAAFLAKACNGDERLFARIERLLALQSRAADFLESPVTQRIDTTIYSPRERPGAVIAGRFRLVEAIGEGGMGTVWAAEQTEPVYRKVALKLIKPGMDSRSVLARFEAERQALALMDHPNIAKVLDGGMTDSGHPFLVMELVNGQPITNYCDAHRLTPRQRLELLVPVCHAIQHAHQKGIIHRDIKPSNILVVEYDQQPVPKVIDFGVAKAVGQPLTEKSMYTGLSQIVGTLEYMSPEQAKVNHFDIDTRSDVYSLGVLLYELLTGSTPFDKHRLRSAAWDEVLRIIREEDPPKPSTRLSSFHDALRSISVHRRTEPDKLARLVRGELDWIVMKALEKDRNRRYETALGFAADLQRYLDDEPVQACPASLAYRLRKSMRRNKAAVSTAVAIGLLLVVGMTVSTLQAVRAWNAEKLAQARLVAETKERDRAVTAEREGKRQLIEARLFQAKAVRWSRQPGRRFEGLKALAEATRLARDLGSDEAMFDALRDEAVACLALADVRKIREWEGWPDGSTSGLSFDADLEHYARSDLKGNITVRRVADDQEVAHLPAEETEGTESQTGARTIHFNHDGSRLAICYWQPLPGGLTNFRLWDWRGRDVILEPGFIPVYAFSPDGKRLALGHPQGTVILFDCVDGSKLQEIRIDAAPQQLAFHPDGTMLAAMDTDGSIELRDLASGELLRKWSTGQRPSGLAWHPDGLLLSTTANREIYLWDPATGNLHGVLQGHRNAGIVASFSPSGDMVFSRSWDGTSRLWDPWAKRELLNIPGWALGFSRDGNRFATQSGTTLVLWEVAQGHEYRALPPAVNVSQPSTGQGGFSSDGQWLAVAQKGGTRLWNMYLKRECAYLPAKFAEDARFDSSTKTLFIAGESGLDAWPIRESSDRIQIGPPRKLSQGYANGISLDRKERIISIAGNAVGRTFALDDSAVPGRTYPHINAVSTTTTPDGSLVATGAHNGFGVMVWESASGELLHHLIPFDRNNRAAFSPDGRWLAIGTEGAVEFWNVNRWTLARRVKREHPNLTPIVVFRSDGKLLAAPMSHSAVSLLDVETGHTVGRLPSSDHESFYVLAFSPDGSSLAVSVDGIVRLWDLRRIRSQLREIGLDWDWPELPPLTLRPPPARVVSDTSSNSP